MRVSTTGHGQARASPFRRPLEANLPLTPHLYNEVSRLVTLVHDGEIADSKEEEKKHSGAPQKENGMPSSDMIILLVVH